MIDEEANRDAFDPRFPACVVGGSKSTPRADLDKYDRTEHAERRDDFLGGRSQPLDRVFGAQPREFEVGAVADA